MLVPPARERVVDVNQLLGELVQFEPALFVAVNQEPGSRERRDRCVADIEARAFQRGDCRFAQAGLVERCLRSIT
jgi:hypothetical protein